MYTIINEPWPWYMSGPLFGLSIPLLLFVLVGYGYPAATIFLFSALLGVFVYGLIQHKLPH